MNYNRCLKSLMILASGALASCGPPAPQLEIMSTSQGTFQGSTANNKVDILWVIDNSGSMLTKQQSLATSFSYFTQVLTTKGFDFHMAIVTTDTRTVLAGGQYGLFQGTPSVITSSVTNWSDTFKSNVVVGAAGDSAAKALDAIEMALSTTNLNGTNSGFLRSSAHLAVIILSDADDDDSTATYGEVETFLDNLKPATTDASTGKSKRSYTVNSVVVDTSNSHNTTCNAPYENGTKFIALSIATSGSLASICEADFSSGLTSLSQGIAEVITQIPLKRAADSSTIVVTFNGSVVPNSSSNGWTYTSSSNTIYFHGNYIPADSTAINVSYTPTDIIR